VSAAVAAISSAMMSESVLDCTDERSDLGSALALRTATTSSRSSAVLTRLPLWPSAMPLPVAVVRNVGCAFSHVVEPVVE